MKAILSTEPKDATAAHAAGLLVAMLAAALLAGCETLPVREAPPTPEPAVVPVDMAERAEHAGEFLLAAREYVRAAQTAEPPQKQTLQLRAVAAFIKAGQIREARELLRGVDATRLEGAMLARRLVLEARLLSFEGAHERAIHRLNEAARMRPLDPALLAEIHQVRAEEELALDNPIGAVRDLIQREQYIVGKEAVAQNQAQLWEILTSLPRARLVAERHLTADPVLGGWIDLATAAIGAAGNPAALANAVATWRAAYPTHPADESLLARLASARPGLIGRIERIALLLPLTSELAVAAEAVRDGFLAMDAANADPDKPKIVIYDLGADPARAPEVYTRAVREGAQAVVGPLGREAAEHIARRADIAVPTILLSHTEENVVSGNLFQFGLPPEQEARQAAERAYLDGHRRAAVLYPNSPWGERLRNAFTTHWQHLGGIVVASEAYDERETDHSEPIKRLLNIEQSFARKERLQRIVGIRIPFDASHARRRQDIDLVFLAADARHGRLIKPQLDYYQAARVPVYATSHIFTGKGDPQHDRDLDGVLFPDMPWILVGSGRIAELRQKLQHGWPHAYTDLDRLYALGVDSYAVIPHLNRIRLEPGARFSGVTSALSLDRFGRLQRQMLWARFSRGVPRLVDTFLGHKGQFEVGSAHGG